MAACNFADLLLMLCSQAVPIVKPCIYSRGRTVSIHKKMAALDPSLTDRWPNNHAAHLLPGFFFYILKLEGATRKTPQCNQH